MKDDWHDLVFSVDWNSRHLIGNPSRFIQLKVLSESLRILSRQSVTGPIKILELGSGSGIVAENLLLHVPDCHVEGVDDSAPMVEIAKSRLARFGGRFRQTMMNLMVFDPSRLTETSYHAIVAFQSLHELPRVNQGRVFRKLRAILRKEGLFFYADRITPNLERFSAAHEGLWRILCEIGGPEGQPTFQERVRRVQSKDDFVAPLPRTLRMLQQNGFTAEPLFVVGERAIIVACIEL